jgi:hypothetical protein
LILVDTSVWVDHLRRGDAQLAFLLERGHVLMHPFVVGELACGSLHDRAAVLVLLQDLPAIAVADVDEVLAFIEHRNLHGKGIGYVDAHLLASVALTPGAQLWTRDKSLLRSAETLGCEFADAASH